MGHTRYKLANQNHFRDLEKGLNNIMVTQFKLTLSCVGVLVYSAGDFFAGNLSYALSQGQDYQKTMMGCWSESLRMSFLEAV